MVVWAALAPDRISPAARAAIDGADVVFVSAVSVYEIDSKRRLQTANGWEALARLPVDLVAAIPTLGFTLIAITPTAARIAAQLPIDHRDPWDRLLLGQASELGIALVSSDGNLHRQFAGVPLVW